MLIKKKSEKNCQLGVGVYVGVLQNWRLSNVLLSLLAFRCCCLSLVTMITLTIIFNSYARFYHSFVSSSLPFHCVSQRFISTETVRCAFVCQFLLVLLVCLLCFFSTFISTNKITNKQKINGELSIKLLFK